MKLVTIQDQKNLNRNYKYFKSLQKLINHSKIISIHLPLNENTRNLFDKKTLSLLKDKYVINTSRAEILDEAIFQFTQKIYKRCRY